MELIWVMFGFFTFITIVFIIIAFVFPEWVGITGKKAHEIQKHQQDDSNSQSPPSKDNN